jgi:pSer/pThr/pTyr-binding forkhead associated (FHA) protein
MLVGRHTDADVRLQLPDVSRRHCRFVFADRRWQVFDLNSLNGIFVNGIRVRHCLLCHRDQVQIGGCTFEVDLPLERPSEAGSDHRPLSQEQIWGSIADALPMGMGEPAPEKRQAS